MPTVLPGASWGTRWGATASSLTTSQSMRLDEACKAAARWGVCGMSRTHIYAYMYILTQTHK